MFTRLSVSILLVFCLVFLINGNASAGTMDNLLIKGVQSNDLNMVKTALANGADINYKPNNNSRTPLGIAIWANNVDLVNFLIKNGANIHLSTWENGVISPPIVLAAWKGSNKIVQILAEAGADVNATNSVGTTPLMFAIMDSADTELTYLLLMKSADPNKGYDSGFTPLMCAARYENGYGHGYEERKMHIAEMLLTVGADPNKKNKAMKTALDYAIDTNFKKMISLLLPVTKIDK